MSVVSFDLETFLVGPGQIPPTLVCGSFAEVDVAPQGHLLNADDTCDLLHELLSDRGVKIVGANIAFDIHVSIKHRPDLLDLWIAAAEADRVHDVLLRQGLIDLSRDCFQHRYSLGDLSSRYLNIDLDKSDNSWRLRYSELAGLPVSEYPYEAKKYAILDAECTARLYLRQERENHSPYFVGLEPLKDEFNQVRSSIWLTAVSNNGLPVDSAKAHLLAEHYEKRAAELRELLIENGLIKVKVSRNMEAVKALDLAGQRDVYKRYREMPQDLIDAGLVKVEHQRDTKAVSRLLADSLRASGREPRRTDGFKPGVHGPYQAIALDKEACSLSDDPLVSAYSEYASVLKSLSTDVPMLMSAWMGRIHTHFTTLRETGRTSSSKPNIQNWGRKGDTRACVVPDDPDDCLVETDFSGLELRCFSQIYWWLFGECRMATVLNSGPGKDDVHSMGVSMLTGMPYEEVIKRKKEPEIDNKRTAMKGGVFGKLGGLGAKTFMIYAKSQYGLTLTLDDSKDLLGKVARAWPEIAHYLQWVNGLLRHGSEGKHDVVLFASHMLRAGVPYCAAANSPFQGLGAHVAKRAGWYVWKATVTPGDPMYGARLVNFVHDSFITQCKRTAAESVKKRQEELMVLAQEELLPNIKGGVESKIMEGGWKK